MSAAAAVGLCAASDRGGDGGAGAGGSADAGANDGAVVLVGGLIEVPDDVCSASPFGAASVRRTMCAVYFGCLCLGAVYFGCLTN